MIIIIINIYIAPILFSAKRKKQYTNTRYNTQTLVKVRD